MTQERSLSEVIRSRRTTPGFDPAVAVDDAALERILEAGLLAPSGYNTQPWRFIVVRDAANKKALRAAAMGQPRVEQAPVVIVTCGDASALHDRDLEEMLRLAAQHGYGDAASHDAVRKNFPRFLAKLEISVWLNRQVMIAFTQMMLMAEALGYDTAPMEGFDESAVRAALDIPEHVEVVALLCLGRLQGKDKPFAGRFDRSRTVFAEEWGAPAPRLTQKK